MRRVELHENFRVAVDGIRYRKLRSMLTVLGVVIGVASVIAVASIIDGLRTTVMDRFKRIGAKTMTISRVQQWVDPGRAGEQVRLRKYLTAEHARAIRESCPHVLHTSILAPRDIVIAGLPNEIRYGGEQVTMVFLRGVDSYFSSVLPGFQVEQGRFLSRYEVEHTRQAVVLGLGLAESLFARVDPVGREVRLNGLPFEVVGVFERNQGMFGTPGGDQIAVIPYSTFEKLYPEIRERFIMASVSDTADLGAAQDEIIATMRRLRRVPPRAPNDFELFMPDFATRLWDEISGSLLLLTGAISSITLLVGGIGVMNIMLISVTERTAEIGLRKAAGARRSDIRAQFLIEAILLTGAGGVLGILAGAGVGWTVSALVPDLPSFVSPFWVAMGMGIAGAVGLFFGFYPANRAAMLDPIACLRHE